MKVRVQATRTQTSYLELEMTQDEYEALERGEHPVIDDLYEAVLLDDAIYDYSWEVI